MAKKKRQTGYRIRPALGTDEPFLWEMLFETVRTEKNGHLLTREILDNPALSVYVAEWGADSDIGFVAEAYNGTGLGAAWCRLMTGVNKGYGFVNELTPELAIAVSPEARGIGLGTELMTQLIAAAKIRYPALCLSVAADNPAKELYVRFGFETIEIREEHPIMILNF